MIANRKEFFGGIGMIVLFFGVLALFFAPIFENGTNGLAYMDRLYNSISKGSVNYMEQITEKAKAQEGKTIDVNLSIPAEFEEIIPALLSSSGLSATVEGGKVHVVGDLSTMLLAVVADCEDMYYNRGDVVSERRGMRPRVAIYAWWDILRSMDKQLKKQKMFAAASDVIYIMNRGVEPAYNYYGIAPQSIMDKIGVVIFSLIFYVVYTLWYGFAILFMFEGWGLKLEH
ncbi:hypothetical protein [Desulfovibrio inopinatus]|uniref:hypothetical protein n=1 Tax=Desulfovibrio inopinatus TaxID=102109 RepID=UPI000428731B|nr:hypothetical protein [Desulfovibrio inopinatus]